MEENKLKGLKVKELEVKGTKLSDSIIKEDVIEAIKKSKAYIIAYVKQDDNVGLIKNVHAEEPSDFMMSLLGGTAALSFIAKYLRSMNEKETNEFARNCANISKDLFNLYWGLLNTIVKEDDNESDE